MTARDVHGVLIGVSPVIDEILRDFPLVERDPTLTFAVRCEPLPPMSSSLEPWYFHGSIQVWRSPHEVVVAGASAQAHVDREGNVIASVDEDPPSAGSLFTLRVALLVALRGCGLFEAHAACVARGGQGALIVGDSGSGKTTLTLAFLAAGFDHAGDDTVLLRDRHAHYFPRPFAVADATVAAFPDLAVHRSERDADGGKWRMDPRAFAPAPLLTVTPSLVLLPTVTWAETTTLEEITRAEAFVALVRGSALVVVPDVPRRDEQLTILRELADRCTVRALHLGADLLTEPRAVALRIWEQVQRANQ